MSLVVDSYLLEMMRDEDDKDLMLGNNDISDAVIDHMLGWNEETGIYETDQGLLFPQPVTKIS